MRVKEVAELLSAEILYDEISNDERDFEHVVAADLMSEIMLDTAEQSLMVTGLINPQVIRTAELMDVYAVVFVRGKEVSAEVTELAKDRGITIMSVCQTMYETCGRLYEAGLTAGR
ncbi:MAG: hypothetical protein K5767_07080 [Clostridia bacterium]|nr:hypothetical protein [Clostridia bacterium]